MCFVLILTPTGFALLTPALGRLFSAVTTIFATGLIALKIILVTRRNRTLYSYKRVIEILVQSAALQSIVLMAGSIIDFLFYIPNISPDSREGHIFVMLQAFATVFRVEVTVSLFQYVTGSISS